VASQAFFAAVNAPQDNHKQITSKSKPGLQAGPSPVKQGEITTCIKGV
jgi:hypothetical protein